MMSKGEIIAAIVFTLFILTYLSIVISLQREATRNRHIVEAYAELGMDTVRRGLAEVDEENLEWRWLE